MTLERPISTSFIQEPSFPGGYSREARAVQQRGAREWRRLQTSRSLGVLGQGILEELNSLAAECQHENWDNQGAAPVSFQSLELARSFLRALPLGTAIPTVGAEADGEVTLEWYRSPRHLLSISFGPKGDLHYASLLGPRKAYGTEPFFGTVPENLLNIIALVRSSTKADAA